MAKWTKELAVLARSLKTVFHIAVLAVSPTVVHFPFGWKSFEEIPSILLAYCDFTMLFHPVRFMFRRF